MASLKTIGSIRKFKIGVTKFVGYSAWQPNYYEHIIRDYVDHLRIADYISNNLRNWNRDEFYDKNNCQIIIAERHTHAQS